MTIQEYVDNFPLEIDQLYVKDSQGKYIVTPGNTKFTKVDVTRYANNTFADLIFTV